MLGHNTGAGWGERNGWVGADGEWGIAGGPAVGEGAGGGGGGGGRGIAAGAGGVGVGGGV